jgi:hypothetical protein
MLEDKYDKVLYPLNLLNRGPMSQLDGAIWLLSTKAPALRSGRRRWFSDRQQRLQLRRPRLRRRQPRVPADTDRRGRPGDQPLLRLLLRFGERRGEVSFEPYAPAAIARNLTLLDDFAAQYERILSRLLAETAASGVPRKVFACTLPYYSSVGYLMDSEDLEYYLRKQNAAYTVPPSFKRVAPPGDPIEDPLLGDRFSPSDYVRALNSGYSVGTSRNPRDRGTTARRPRLGEREEHPGASTGATCLACGLVRSYDRIGGARTKPHRRDRRSWRTAIRPQVVAGGAFRSTASIGYTGQAYVANFPRCVERPAGNEYHALRPRAGLFLDPIDRDGDG